MQNFADLLDAMEGIVYVVDPDGYVLACGRTAWDRFLVDNGGPSWLRADRVLGRNLFACIAGAEVVSRYRAWLHAMAQDYRGPLTFLFRCDSPNEMRQMRMSISRIDREHRIFGFLFQSIHVAIEYRPPLNIYDSALHQQELANDKSLPIVGICSFCQRLQCPGHDGTGAEEGDWVSAEEYYRRGGSSRVRLSHGICPRCDGDLPTALARSAPGG
jgi:hypothetical protein